MVRTNDKTFCIEVKEHQVKKGSKWVTTEREINNLTAQQYRNSCGEETMKWFNSVFGPGTFRRTKNYTSEGYIVVKATSISPSKDERSVSYYYPVQEWQRVKHKYQGGFRWSG